MVRPAELGDVPWIRKLWADWLQEAPLPFGDEDEVAVGQDHLLRAVITGETPGLALVVPEDAVLLWAGPPPNLHGFGVFVAAGARRRGLGTLLTAEACRLAKAAGYRRVIVAPYVNNVLSIAWLRGDGFAPLQTVLVKEL